MISKPTNPLKLFDMDQEELLICVCYKKNLLHKKRLREHKYAIPFRSTGPVALVWSVDVAVNVVDDATQT